MHAPERLAVAQAVTAAVLTDWHGQGGPPATAEVWLDDDGAVCIHVWQDGMGGGTTPSAWAQERAELEVEVADYVHAELMDDSYVVLPICPRHGSGVHPCTHEAATSWWCSPGDHSLGVIGTLR